MKKAVFAAVVLAAVAAGAFLLSRRAPMDRQAAEPEAIKVLVSSFQNRTGNPVFDGVLEKALDISLADTSFLSVYNRQDAIKLAAQLDPGAGETLDEKLALLVSRRAGIAVVTGGEVDRGDKGYTVRVWAKDTVKSKRIFDGIAADRDPARDPEGVRAAVVEAGYPTATDQHIDGYPTATD